MAILSIALASLTVGVVLYLSNRIERILGDQGLQIVSRLMGLFVCALAAQIILPGYAVIWCPEAAVKSGIGQWPARPCRLHSCATA